eukprot:s133_g23.t1
MRPTSGGQILLGSRGRAGTATGGHIPRQMPALLSEDQEATEVAEGRRGELRRPLPAANRLKSVLAELCFIGALLSICSTPSVDARVGRGLKGHCRQDPKVQG